MLSGLNAFTKFKNVVIVRSNDGWKLEKNNQHIKLKTYMKYSDILLEQYGKTLTSLKVLYLRWLMMFTQTI
jgi:hypothetical protein